MIVDPLTGERTLQSPVRDRRPNEFREDLSAGCPFCPGNEAQTPPQLAAIADGNGGWLARAFANKFPAARVHEVIVDAPTHDAEITAAGWQLWRERYLSALHADANAIPVLFKNRGAYAGATLTHPHAQMIVLDALPPRWLAMREASASHCVLCGEIESALAAGSVVARRGQTIAFVRERGRFSWGLTLCSTTCVPSIDRADPAAWTEAGALLANSVDALMQAMGDGIPFNVLAMSDPRGAGGQAHWHLELVPRLSTLAGFELSTGAFIRGASAEESASRWRQIIAASHGPV